MTTYSMVHYPSFTWPRCGGFIVPDTRRTYRRGSSPPTAMLGCSCSGVGVPSLSELEWESEDGEYFSSGNGDKRVLSDVRSAASSRGAPSPSRCRMC